MSQGLFAPLEEVVDVVRVEVAEAPPAKDEPAFSLELRPVEVLDIANDGGGFISDPVPRSCRVYHCFGAISHDDLTLWIELLQKAVISTNSTHRLKDHAINISFLQSMLQPTGFNLMDLL